jgi:hypothetical protein
MLSLSKCVWEEAIEMADKDVERNVRSTTVEGITTPTQRYVHALGEQHAISFGEKAAARKTKESLLEKFRRREQRRRGETGEKSETGESERETSGGEDSPE